jgi:hypothetical protein
LSLSASPAFAPCGIPFALEPDDVAVGVLAEPALDEVVAGVDGLDDPVVELDELEPQAARPRAASTSKAAARRRVDLVRLAFIIAPKCRAWQIAGKDQDACSVGVVPAR